MKIKILAAIALLAATTPIHAQETSPVDPTAETKSNLPVNAPDGAVVKSLGGFYMWGKGGAWDASIQKQGDPNADQSIAANPSAQPVSPDMPLPQSSSTSTRGAVGYVMPSGSVSPTLGSNVRAEFGLSQTTAAMPLGGTNAAPTVYNGIALGGCSTCVTSGYDATEMSAKAASDYKFNSVTLTPSVTVFSSQSEQNFTGSNTGTLGWRDTGAKVGLDSKLDLNKQVSIGVGGSYGRAQREVSLSSASGAQDTSPYLANGEAKLTYKPEDQLSLSGFAGVANYDNRMPAVATGNKVDYSSTANTYYGAGATWHFGTK